MERHPCALQGTLSLGNFSRRRKHLSAMANHERCWESRQSFANLTLKVVETEIKDRCIVEPHDEGTNSHQSTEFWVPGREPGQILLGRGKHHLLGGARANLTHRVRSRNALEAAKVSVLSEDGMCAGLGAKTKTCFRESASKMMAAHAWGSVNNRQSRHLPKQLPSLRTKLILQWAVDADARNWGKGRLNPRKGDSSAYPLCKPCRAGTGRISGTLSIWSLVHQRHLPGVIEWTDPSERIPKTQKVTQRVGVP